MLLHTILSLKRTLYLQKQGDKEMFEITYSDSEIFEDYQYAGKAHKGGTYDFTFENRYLIYHAPLRREVDYIAIDMTTGLSSSVITKAPGNYYTKESYRKLIPHILYSVKYTGDVRYLNRFADNPLEVIDSIFRVVLPNNGYHIREEQISLAKQMYIGFTEKQIALCEAEVGTGKTLSYLVAAIVAKHHNSRIYAQKLPVTITTSSIELQKALVEREIPNLSRMLLDYYIIEKPLTAVLRKGKEHYLCRYRFEDYLRNIKQYPEKYASTVELLEQMADFRFGIDLDRYRISGAIKNRICIKGSCAGCSQKKQCKYHDFAKQKLSHRMRGDIDGKINRLPLKYFSANSYGDVLSRVTNDVDTIGQGLSNSAASIVSASAQFIGCLIMMFWTDWIMAVTTIVTTVLGIFFMAFIMKHSQHYFKERQRSLGKLNGYIEEIYSGHDVIRISNAEKSVKDKFTQDIEFFRGSLVIFHLSTSIWLSIQARNLSFGTRIRVPILSRGKPWERTNS